MKFYTTSIKITGSNKYKIDQIVNFMRRQTSDMLKIIYLQLSTLLEPVWVINHNYNFIQTFITELKTILYNRGLTNNLPPRKANKIKIVNRTQLKTKNPNKTLRTEK